MTNSRWGHVRGEHTPYALGHSARSRAYYIVNPITGCWIWQGTRDAGGYGRRWSRTEGRVQNAHVVFWEEIHGSVPEGLDLDHLCRNRACVNPDHMEPVTRSENIRRGLGSKLTIDDARAIKASTRPLKDVAAQYGITMSMVSQIRRGVAWRDA